MRTVHVQAFNIENQALYSIFSIENEPCLS